MHPVLVVDDDHIMRGLIHDWVESLGFDAHDAGDAQEALDVLAEQPINIAVCDIHMPGHNGVWLASQIRDRYPDTAIVMATAERDVELAIASLRNDVVDYLLKPFSRERLGEAQSLGCDWHATAVGLQELQDALQDRLRTRRASVAESISAAQETSQRALDGLIEMLQLHLRDGRGHATRVARLAVALADELGLSEDEVQLVERAALLHDIGKLDMPASILSKPAPLDEAEWRVMRTHPQVGYDLLRKQSRFADAAEIVLSHHEAWDGSGYPRALSGEEIPLGARILTVADSYDSMTYPHTQRPAMVPSMAVREIERCRGRQFDPTCAEALGDVLMHAFEVKVA